MKRILIVVAIVIVVLGLAAALVGPWIAGKVFTAAKHREIGPVPDGLRGEAVEFANSDGKTIRGWFFPGEPGKGAVVLMHGVGGSRLSMLSRARFLSDEGFTLLDFDFQAHGESDGDSTSFGYVERLDASAALEYMKSRVPGEKIGVLAISMGGAAALLARPELEVQAEVLELVYPSLDRAIVNRLNKWMGGLGDMLAPRMLQEFGSVFGADPAAVRPIDGLSRPIPRLLVAGAQDPYTPLDESRALFLAAQGPKSFWSVPVAKHSDVYALAPDEYETRVLALFAVLSR